MNWLIPGFLYAFCNALVIFTNEKFKINPSLLGMWRGFGSALLAVPFMFFITPPQDIWFWVFAVLQGLMVGYFDFKLFSAAVRFGAGGTSMMSVLAILLSFVLWWFIDWSRLMELIHAPQVFIPILLCIAGSVVGYTRLAGGKMDKNLLRYMAPAIIMLSLMTLNSKNIVDKAPLVNTIVYYLIVIGSVGGLFNLLLYYVMAQDKSLSALKALALERNSLHGGLLITGCSILLMVTKNISMQHIPNPGYLNALALTTPLWILLLNRFMHIHTRVNAKAAVFTLLCVGLLVYFANIPLPPMPY